MRNSISTENNLLFSKEILVKTFDMMNQNKIFPKNFLIENFFYFLNDNAFHFLKVIEHFKKENDIDGIKHDLFCGGGNLDLRDDFLSFDLNNKALIENIIFEFNDSDCQEVRRVINKKAPNIDALLNKRIIEHIIHKHPWLLLEIKARTFGDSYARDGFIEWLFLELTGNDIPCPLRNPKEYKVSLELVETKIKNHFSVLELVK